MKDGREALLAVIARVEQGQTPSREELTALLRSDAADEELFAAADRVRRQHVVDEVHLRGLIEFSNIC